MKKDYMFQYAYNKFGSIKIIENTDLIPQEEAYQLWDKYLEDCVSRLKNGDEPQMCIWSGCPDNITYIKTEREIDYQDSFYENGKIYRIKKTLLYP